MSSRYRLGMDRTERIDALIERLARLDAARRRRTGLNATQAAALAYLARANRFSRSPSVVADYLVATRGTVSQTLRALIAKGLVVEAPDPTDRRGIILGLTAAGRAVVTADTGVGAALARLDPDRRADIEASLAALLGAMLAEAGGAGFGICQTCRHHRVTAEGRHCDLLRVPLTAREAEELCHEHAA